jgi:hypothetical protein
MIEARACDPIFGAVLSRMPMPAQATALQCLTSRMSDRSRSGSMRARAKRPSRRASCVLKPPSRQPAPCIKEKIAHRRPLCVECMFPRFPRLQPIQLAIEDGETPPRVPPGRRVTPNVVVALLRVADVISTDDVARPVLHRLIARDVRLAQKWAPHRSRFYLER